MGRAGPRYTVTPHAAPTAPPEDPPGFIVAEATVSGGLLRRRGDDEGRR